MRIGRYRLPKGIPVPRGPLSRLALGVFCALLIVGVLQTLISATAFRNLTLASYQRTHQELASRVASLLTEHLSPRAEPAKVRELLRQIETVHPESQIYLLDRHGIVQEEYLIRKPAPAFFVDLRPLRKALANGAGVGIVRTAQDPADIHLTKLFSVASLRIEGDPGYLYVVLGDGPLGGVSDQVRSFWKSRTLFVLLGLSAMTALLLTGLVMYVLSKRYRALTEILTHISHDIRSPLSTVRTYLETLLLRDDRMNATQRQKFLGVALRHTSSVCRLLHDLLEISDGRRLREAIVRAPFPAVEAAATAIDRYRERAAEKRISLEIRYDRSLPEALGDRTKIERALGNLVENAIRYTPAGGRVAVSVEQVEYRIRFTVRDTGAGIPASERKRIFRKFYRGASALKEEPKGCGLGLSLVQEIVKAHGDRIRLESALGSGSKFSFLVPAALPSVNGVPDNTPTAELRRYRLGA